MCADVNPDGFDFPSFCREEEARLRQKYPGKSDKEIADMLGDRVEYLIKTGKVVDEEGLDK